MTKLGKVDIKRQIFTLHVQFFHFFYLKLEQQECRFAISSIILHSNYSLFTYLFHWTNMFVGLFLNLYAPEQNSPVRPCNAWAMHSGDPSQKKRTSQRSSVLLHHERKLSSPLINFRISGKSCRFRFFAAFMRQLSLQYAALNFSSQSTSPELTFTTPIHPMKAWARF